MAEEENSSDEKATFTELAKKLSRLPAEKKRAALESSASIAAVSLRVSRDFIDAVPKAAKLLSADDLRSWGELGRRIAMADVESGSKFYTHGVAWLADLPEAARPTVFQLLTRQLVLSSSTAHETLELLPKLSKQIDDRDLLAKVLQLAADLANRSAKHSVELLKNTPDVAAALKRFGDEQAEVAESIFSLASNFANRTGGMTADLWSQLPGSLKDISAANAKRLLTEADSILQFGGTVTLHFIASGNAVLSSVDAVFDDWCSVVRSIAKHGNAPLIAFLRATPRFVAQMRSIPFPDGVSSAAARVLALVDQIAETDGESALAAFRSSAYSLRSVSSEHFQKWVENGIDEFAERSFKARRSYFALETRESNSFLLASGRGLQLESVRSVLRMYIEGLTGREIEIESSATDNSSSNIGDGRTIRLPVSISEFGDDDADFRLYKVLAAHGAGQIEFGTFDKDTVELKAAFADLNEFFDADNASKNKLPKDSDHNVVLNAFPEPRLAKKIFGTMENARIDRRLRGVYRGLRKDLDLMRDLLAKQRPFIFDLPMEQVPFELLFQITLCGGATDDAKRFYGQIVSEIETIIDRYLSAEEANVADSIIAASRVYSLFQNVLNENVTEQENESDDETGDHVYEDLNSGESVTEDRIKQEPKPKDRKDIQDLFNAWNSSDEDGEPDDISGAEAWAHNEMPEQALESGDVAFAYDEWDRELRDHRVGWSRVIEKKVKQGDRTFVEIVRSRYRGVITSVRHQFQLMKPENLTRVNREIDGEDYDLNALVDLVIDRKADGRQSENIYTKKLRKRRDVAVSILLDQSSSTARTITRNPLQPYTHPGRRIIEIEKEGLVLMSEALEAVGDAYSISGFTSEGRRNVKFYKIKDFDEKYSAEVERRIGGITFQNNTRLGAAIRHSVAKLLVRESRTKLLIILTDGRPYDHDYGDARYAREDVREALHEARISGITPFCITIDRESEAELKDLYDDVGYTIIDDVLSLPERMPNIYRRLTS